MSKKHILVADDDQDICALLFLFLSDEGHEISFVSDGMSCMSSALRKHPDLVILDLGLPAGDGLTTLQRLREHPHLSRVPVVVLTGREGEEWKDRAMTAGANVYLKKPITKDSLLEAVRKFLPSTQTGKNASGKLHCPHCDSELQDVRVTLDPASIEAIASALQPV